MPVYLKLVLFYIALLHYSVAILSKEHFNLYGSTNCDLLMAKKVCYIASKAEAKVNLVYFSQLLDSHSYNLELALQKCMLELPTFMLKLEHLKQEPLRPFSSLSVFVLPTSQEDVKDRLSFLGQLLNKRQRNKDSHKYMFVWKNATMSQLKELFELLWSKHILKVIALTDDKNVYTFEPFSPVGLNELNVKLLEKHPYFYDKLTNMYGNQLRISMFRDWRFAVPKADPTQGFVGMDGIVADTIAGKLNATAVYITPSDQDNYGRCVGNNFTGVLSYIVPGHTDIGFNNRFTLKCVKPHIEETYQYYRRIVYLVVPAAKKLPQYLLFIHGFEAPLWRLLVAVLLLCIIIYYMLHRLALFLPTHLAWSQKTGAGLLHTTVMFVRSHFGDPILVFPEISSLRQFLITWIMYCYVVTSIYFAKLESGFVKPNYEPELDSLNQLSQLNVPIYGISTMLQAAQQSMEPRQWAEIEKRKISLPLNYSTYPYALLLVEKTKHLGMLLGIENIKTLLIKTYDNENDRPVFHIVKEPLNSLTVSYIATMGCPYLYKIERFISAFFEMGLLEHWRDLDVHFRIQNSYSGADVSDYLDNEADGDPDPTDDDDAVVLTLDILQGAFYLWSIGVGLSMSSFVLEFIYYFYRQCRLGTKI